MSKYTLNVLKAKLTTTGAPMYPELREVNPKLMGKYRVLLSARMPVQATGTDVASAKQILIGDLKAFYLMVERGAESTVEGFQSGDFVNGLSTLRSQRELAGGPWAGAGFAYLKNSAS